MAFYAADGGYYDNSGIVRALDVMDDWLRSPASAGVARKIALVELGAGGPVEETTEKAPTRHDLMNSLAGPLTVLFSVRTTSQVARNQFDVEMVRRVWALDHGAELRHFTFRLDGDTPLS